MHKSFLGMRTKRMSLKDLDPNILLILIGAAFVLIGASGKIFIEKFSVAVASVGSRIFVIAIGLVMLGIGVVGPSKLFRSQVDGPAASKPIQLPSGHIRPSFDCARVTSKVEEIVCSSPELAVLDLTVANAYRDAMARLHTDYERGQLKDAQLFWLQEVRGKCQDAACVKAVYKVRERQLRQTNH
jgi:uncharacterized protein YecT (DUF1311 family)